MICNCVFEPDMLVDLPHDAIKGSNITATANVNNETNKPLLFRLTINVLLFVSDKAGTKACCIFYTAIAKIGIYSTRRQRHRIPPYRG